MFKITDGGNKKPSVFFFGGNMFDIEAELKKLPNKPGVYIMKDKQDKILYVGKAIVLKNRVRQYFRKNNKTKRIENMVLLIDHFEYIVTDNEAEALILECNLIKQNRPKFNVLLKDDKTYPYIKIDIKNDYPSVYITRTRLNDGAKYFGPYANSGSAKEMVDFIKERFKIRQCKNFKSIKRACLNYYIHRCSAPCMGYISKEDYKKQIDQIILLLEGKIEPILKSLDEEIKIASQKQEYEEAAYLRDKKIAIERISQKQKVSNLGENDIDVIGLAKNEFNVCIEIFFVRNSKMIGRNHYFFKDMKDVSNNEILSSFVKQYYMPKEEIPHKIMLREEIEDKDIIQNILSEKAGRKVELKSPQKGEKLRFVEMAEKNAKVTLENSSKENYNVLVELKQILGLEKLPKRIETYDISNISGTDMVAGMCVLQDGMINKKLSKRFKIKTVFSQDDPKCMKEVIIRRIKHSIENPKGAFGTIPDAIFVDGGITQQRAAKSAIQQYNLEIPIFGMVKNDKHRTRALINENRKEIPLSEELMKLITNFQDEVHNVAITYHRKVRDKKITKSELDKIKGIGNIKKQDLLKKFGSVNQIKKADINEIMKVKGISKDLAIKIKDEL